MLAAGQQTGPDRLVSEADLETGLVAPARDGALLAFRPARQPGTVLRQNLEDAIGDDAMPQVIGMAAVVVDHPAGAGIGPEQIDEEAAFGGGDLGYTLVVGGEDIETGVAPVLAADREIGHEVRAGEDDDRIELRPHPADE